MSVLCLVNPRARRLRRGQLSAEEVQRTLGRAGDVVITKDLDHARQVLEAKLTRELACVVTVGGDGALHWAINLARPIARARGLSLPPFLPARSGTIDFVARAVGLEGAPVDILARLAARVRAGEPIPTRSIPTARFVIEPTEGERDEVLGFAAALGGIGVRFFDQYYAEPDPTAATILRIIARVVAGYPFGTGRAREMFRPTRARVRVDNAPVDAERHDALHVGAIPIALGALRVFPLARDGHLHVHAGRLSPASIIASIPALLRGGLIEGEGFVERAASRMEIDAVGDEALAAVIDGERYLALARVTVDVGPSIEVALV